MKQNLLMSHDANTNLKVNLKINSKNEVPSFFAKKNINENYINFIDTNRQTLYVHMIICLIMSITYSSFYTIIVMGMSNIHQWISIITMFFGLIYVMFSGIYISRVITEWNMQNNDGFNKFRETCISLSIKNYRLMKEYREVYHFHYGDVFNRCIDRYKNGELKSISSHELNKSNNDSDVILKDYVKFVLHNDSTEKLESYEWIQSIIEKTIHKYFKLCYYLSFLKSNDKLSFNQNIIYVNIGSDSVLNKRNRKLESIMNAIPLDYKHELIGAWNMLDKKLSHDVMINIPCKWIIYEYRNMFRYLYCAKYFKLIHSSFEKDYIDIENHVQKINNMLHQLISCKINNPKVFTQLYGIVSNITLFIFDNFVALNLISCIFTTGAIVMPIILAMIMQLIIVCTISSISSLASDVESSINGTDNLENLDEKIEAIFDEMEVILIDGKIKHSY